MAHKLPLFSHSLVSYKSPVKERQSEVACGASYTLLVPTPTRTLRPVRKHHKNDQVLTCSSPGDLRLGEHNGRPVVPVENLLSTDDAAEGAGNDQLELLLCQVHHLCPSGYNWPLPLL